MLKFTSVSASVRAFTDITLTGTIIPILITIDLIIDRITGRTMGTEGIVTRIITGTSLTGIAAPGWLEAFEPA